MAGACFILPSALIVGTLAWTYARFGRLPQVAAVLYGVKPVIIAVVLQALIGLARSAVCGWTLAVLLAGSVAAAAAGVDELVVLLAAGAAAVGARGLRPRAGAWFPLLPLGVVAGAGAQAPSLAKLFLVFLKIGSVLFGSGYVLLAFLRTDLVQRLGWLSEAQLLDAVVVGQVTPGPVFTTATFVGYLVGGAPGAALATLGIFLPAFVLVALSGPLVPRLRRSPWAGAFLDGVNVASLALMAVVTWQLGRAALVDGWTVALAAIGAGLLVGLRLNSTWLVLGGAVAGVLLRGGWR